jgi:starch phosphorylase
VFLEDYEMDVARHMVAGVDVWLNNPAAPARGVGNQRDETDALHGGLNLSILDGWWPEGYNKRERLGHWERPRPRRHQAGRSPRRDADLYRLLEKEVVPLYYRRAARGKSDLPKQWIARMKNALMTIPPFFNTDRQVKEYLTKHYLPAMRKA